MTERSSSMDKQGPQCGPNKDKGEWEEGEEGGEKRSKKEEKKGEKTGICRASTLSLNILISSLF